MPIEALVNVPFMAALALRERRDACDGEHDLVQGSLLAEDVLHPKTVVVCAICGELNEVADPKEPPHRQRHPGPRPRPPHRRPGHH